MDTEPVDTPSVAAEGAASGAADGAAALPPPVKKNKGGRPRKIFYDADGNPIDRAKLQSQPKVKQPRKPRRKKSALVDVVAAAAEAAATGVVRGKDRRKSKANQSDSEDDIEDRESQRIDADERHFILRLPKSLADRVRAELRENRAPEFLDIEFKEERRAVVRISDTGETHIARLVDLPCIIESHKTFDSKQFYKIQDICQMLVVDEKSTPADFDYSKLPPLRKSDTVWLDGLTKPLFRCRRRRFRKRTSKQTIEDVEREVRQLLERDEEAEQIKYGLTHDTAERLDSATDTDYTAASEVGTPAPYGSDTERGEDDEYFSGSSQGKGPTDGKADDDAGDEDESDSDIDDELAAMVDQQLAAGGRQANQPSSELDMDRESAVEIDGEYVLEHGDDGDVDGDVEEGGDENRQMGANRVAMETSFEREYDASGDDAGEMDELEDDDDENEELRKRRDELQEDIINLDARIAEKQMQADTVENSVLKNRYREQWRQLVVQRESKKNELTDIVEQLG